VSENIIVELMMTDASPHKKAFGWSDKPFSIYSRHYDPWVCSINSQAKTIQPEILNKNSLLSKKGSNTEGEKVTKYQLSVVICRICGQRLSSCWSLEEYRCENIFSERHPVGLSRAAEQLDNLNGPVSFLRDDGKGNF